VGAVELRTTAMVVGGEAVARQGSGRVVFVAGALPGETVSAELVEERKSFARASVREILQPSGSRAEPPCPHVAQGCGGCDWQHAVPEAQHGYRLALVSEVLTRQGAIIDPVVRSGPAVPYTGVRTTVRGHAGPDGRFAYRRRRSHARIEVDSCLIAHPLVQELVAEGRFPGAGEVMIRIGSRTGERMVVVDRAAHHVKAPADVIVVERRALASGRRAWLHEEAVGRRWRISAGSFFQASPEGAEALVASVAGFVECESAGLGPLVDLCCGVGLLAGSVAVDGQKIIGVERNGSAVSDARVNLADRRHRLVKVAVARWRPSPAAVVVADPARSGLGEVGVGAVSATGAQLCVLVSCDPAALGRDARLLQGAGYCHLASEVVDLFGHTSHVEVVSAFVKQPQE